MNCFATASFWAGRKIAQIGQTERKPCGRLSVTRRCTRVHREAKFVRSTRQSKKKKFAILRISSLNLNIVLVFRYTKRRDFLALCGLRILLQPLLLFSYSFSRANVLVVRSQTSAGP